MSSVVERNTRSGPAEAEPGEAIRCADELHAYRDSLRVVLEDCASRYRIPGICLEVSSGGRRLGVAVGKIGVASRLPMTRNTRFELGIIGTALVSLAVLELSHAGEVDIESPVATYLPELDGSSVGSQVAVRHLLSHSGGHRCVDLADAHVRESYSWTQCVSELREAPLLFAPGSVFSFSPLATVLLREIVRRITGESATELVRSRVLTPLSVRTGFVHEDRETPSSCAGYHEFDARRRVWRPTAPLKLNEFWRASPTEFTMSVRDLVTVYDAILTGRDEKLSGKPVISRPTALGLQERVIHLPSVSGGQHSERLPLSCGFGCAEYLPNWHGNNGPVFGQSVLIRYHRMHRGVVAIGASANAPAVCESIVDAVARSLEGEHAGAPKHPDSLVSQSSELLGMYHSPAGWSARIGRIAANAVSCKLSDSRNAALGELSLEMRPEGGWAVASDPGRWPIGIFRDPVLGEPCLMIGLSAYKKVSSAALA